MCVLKCLLSKSEYGRNAVVEQGLSWCFHGLTHTASRAAPCRRCSYYPLLLLLLSGKREVGARPSEAGRFQPLQSRVRNRRMEKLRAVTTARADPAQPPLILPLGSLTAKQLGAASGERGGGPLRPEPSQGRKGRGDKCVEFLTRATQKKKTPKRRSPFSYLETKRNAYQGSKNRMRVRGW